MKIVSEEITYMVQRKADSVQGGWVDSTGTYHGEEDGLKAAVVAYRDMVGTFGKDNVRIQRKRTTVEAEVVDDWEIAVA